MITFLLFIIALPTILAILNILGAAAINTAAACLLNEKKQIKKEHLNEKN